MIVLVTLLWGCDEAVYTMDTRLIYTCITLPVRHAYDKAVYTMYT